MEETRVSLYDANSLHGHLDADALAAFLDEHLDDSEAAKHVDRSAMRTQSARDFRRHEFHQPRSGAALRSSWWPSIHPHGDVVEEK